MNPFTDPSLRRYTLALAGLIATAGNKKLGLDISPDEVLGLLAFLAAVIGSSNLKAVAEAKAAGASAAASVTAGPAADAVVEAAAKGAP